MEIIQPFQGVACCCLDDDYKSIQKIFTELLDLDLNSLILNNITCNELELSNKYYKTKIHLFDNKLLSGEDPTKKRDIYDKCQAILFYGDGKKLTIDLLDKQVESLKSVRGEPRILLYHGIDEECEPYKTLSDWCLSNNFDLIDTCDEEIKDLLINSLSAYKWEHRISLNDPTYPNLDTLSQTREASSTTTGTKNNIPPQSADLNDETLKKLMDFDNLLGKLSAIKDKPDIRGNPDDKNILEIAEILSNLLGEDAEGFLDSEEEAEDKQDNNDKTTDETQNS